MPTLIIWPQLGVGGCTPIPRKLSEASSIIQEAAHEDANIIFGAVVDPTMEGTIKITMIATGFDKPEMMQRPQQESRTPADLNNYERDGVWQVPPRVASAPAMPLGRRQALDLHPQAYSADEHLATGTDDASPLDIPAFLSNRGHS